ncbi:MAG: glycosyltransferase family 39 protein [Lachnospiraceae bacterium]|nr:glycosyltransferase family 39 protein [Lachnospiraceae bacterium]
MKYLPSLKQRRTLLILIVFMLIGFGLRIAACYWGYPYHLHPDEPTIVAKAIDMISRHSWEANVYNRPDHFEIKCCAVLFQIVSFLKYHVSADVAFSSHEMAFYLIARGYTAIFGTLMIPLSYLLLEKCKKGSGLIGAGIVTFFTIFVEHSAYATPDIVLTFMVMLEAYISLLYLDKPDKNKVIAMSIVAGLGITVKYTCAICCLYIAFIVIYDCMKRKSYRKIFVWGLLAVGVVLFTCFFMAPNLFTNISSTISTLKKEARTTHLGADGLGTFGNFCYYLRTFMKNIGNEIIVFEVIGLAYVLKSKNRNCICIILGVLFWVCTSILALHWERWGMPIYIFYVLVAALGISYAFDLLKSLAERIPQRSIIKSVQILLICFVCLLGVDIMLSGITKTMNKLSTDTRLTALDYCKENGITSDNSLADGYTPYKMKGSGTVPVNLDEDGMIVLGEDQANASYIILSSNMYNRYYAEPERYSSQVKMYDAIQEQCELIAKFSPTSYKSSSWLFQDIVYKLKYICNYDEDTSSGNTILIYRIVQ